MEQLEFFDRKEENKGICIMCGNKFNRINTTKVYCSKKCQGKNNYIKNKEKFLQRSRDFRLNNKDYYKQWKLDNPDKVIAWKQKEETKQRKRNWQKNWASKKENKDKINKYEREKEKNDPTYKVSQRVRGRIRKLIKQAGSKKFYKTSRLLGCTSLEAKEHLEKQFKDGMTWENHGNNGWHIDHIIPCASFDLTDPEQQKKCFHYTNLQPLWASENMSKGAKLL